MPQGDSFALRFLFLDFVTNRCFIIRSGSINHRGRIKTTTCIINNGAHQTVELPEGCRIEGDEAFVKRIDNAVVLLSRNNPWEPLIKSLSMFSDV